MSQHELVREKSRVWLGSKEQREWSWCMNSSKGEVHLVFTIIFYVINVFDMR